MQRSDRLLNLQLLRILAAVAVVLYHARSYPTAFDPGFDPSHLAWGFKGVDVFFIISGFIMVYITRDGAPKPFDFIGRRFLRVWPLYVIVTLVAAILAAYAPRFYSAQHDLAYVLKSIFFVPAARELDQNFYPIMVPGWSLNLEVVFYSLFGLALFFKQRALALIAMTTALMAISVASSVPEIRFYSFSGHGIMFEFLFGVGLGHLYLAQPKLPLWFAWMLVALGTALLVLPLSGHRPVAVGIPALLVVAGALFTQQPKSERLASLIDFLGRISFALYLTHIFALVNFRVVVRDAGIQVNGWLYIAAVLTISIALASAVYVLIEKPIGRWLASRSTSRPIAVFRSS